MVSVQILFLANFCQKQIFFCFSTRLFLTFRRELSFSMVLLCNFFTTFLPSPPPPTPHIRLKSLVYNVFEMPLLFLPLPEGGLIVPFYILYNLRDPSCSVDTSDDGSEVGTKTNTQSATVTRSSHWFDTPSGKASLGIIVSILTLLTLSSVTYSAMACSSINRRYKLLKKI